MRVAVCGGTHGNELAGPWVVKLLGANPPEFAYEGLDVFGVVTNPRAVERCARFIDSDLNRAFTGEPAPGYEAQRAEELRNGALSDVDFVIDLHTSTSDVGLMVCMPVHNSLSTQCAVHAVCPAHAEPVGKVFVERQLGTGAATPGSGALCTTGARGGIELEVGPVAHGVLQQRIVRKMTGALHRTLQYLSAVARGVVVSPPRQLPEAYIFMKKLRWSRAGDGTPLEMVAPALQNFTALRLGDPVFVGGPDGDTCASASEENLVPVFVHEAAYSLPASGEGISLSKRIAPAVVRRALAGEGSFDADELNEAAFAT
jgi:succinylglutamate desuccinylase